MENQNNKSVYYWLLPLQAFPAVGILFILYPLEYLDSYGKILAILHLLISCATIPNIQSFKHISFRIWVCSSFLIPLPILIFVTRLYLEPNLLAQYYFFLLLFFILNYQLRNLKIFIPLLLISLFGSIFIWGVSEMFSGVNNEYFFHMSPILNFFLILGDKMILSVFYLGIISLFGYIILLTNKYIFKGNA